jgi:hypothetical protein
MRVLKLYDPGRRGTWLDQLAPGEYPLFLRDGKTWAERDADGKPLGRRGDSVCLVFSSLDEAKQFGEQKVRERPDLRCDIYDREGLRNPPLCSFGDREWNPAPRTLLWLAGGCAVASVPLFFWDWSRRGELVLASLIGINLIAAALRLLFWGLGALDDRREQRKRAA